ncbi:uncharacterized protein LOC143213611 [Lasioglossum baleicum]|uniref:uncharacterized protein LOC143213611 n=1 Tax=Lasioglossum baleicum TaxID=434251 RepID=UPI003FCE85A9
MFLVVRAEQLIEHSANLLSFRSLWIGTSSHAALFTRQGAQRKANTIPPARIKAIMARIVHVLEAEVTRVDNSLLLAGSSTTSSVFRPSLLALPSKNLRRRDAFSQDILNRIDVLLLSLFGDAFHKVFRLCTDFCRSLSSI